MSARGASGAKRTTRSQATQSKIPLRSPLKAAARPRVTATKDENASSNEVIAGRKRARESNLASSTANKKARKDEIIGDEPLSPRNTNTPELSHGDDPMQIDGAQENAGQGSSSQLFTSSDDHAPTTPSKPPAPSASRRISGSNNIFATGSTPVRSPKTPGVPGTASRLPRPFFKSSAIPSSSAYRTMQKPVPSSINRQLFPKTTGLTPAKSARGPLTRAANIKRYTQPLVLKKTSPPKKEPSVLIGSPSKGTGIFKVAAPKGVPEETARETQKSLSLLDDALRRLAAPRPAPRRPQSSLGFNADGNSSADTSRTEDKDTIPERPPLERPGTSMGFSPMKSKIGGPTSLYTIPGSPSRSPSRPSGRSVSASSPSAAAGPSKSRLPQPAFGRMGPPATPRSVSAQSALPVPIRRPTVTPGVLSRTLSEISAAAAQPKPKPMSSSSTDTSASKKEKPRLQPTRAPSSRIKAQKDHVSDSPGSVGNTSERPASSSKPPKPKDMTPKLSVLKHCTVFVDVRTDEGDDAAALFTDMLRGLGARILTRMSTSLTHIVFKSGLPSTVSKYRMFDPKPAVVGIGWVVECAEKRERVDESRFAVDLDTADTKQKRKADAPLNPVPHRRIFTADESGDEADNEEANESTFTAAEETFLEFDFEKSIVGINVPSSSSKSLNSSKSRKSSGSSLKNSTSGAPEQATMGSRVPKQKEIGDFFAAKRRSSDSGFKPRIGSPLRESSLPPTPDDEGQDESEMDRPILEAMEE